MPTDRMHNWWVGGQGSWQAGRGRGEWGWGVGGDCPHRLDAHNWWVVGGAGGRAGGRKVASGASHLPVSAVRHHDSWPWALALLAGSTSSLGLTASYTSPSARPGAPHKQGGRGAATTAADGGGGGGGGGRGSLCRAQPTRRSRTLTQLCRVGGCRGPSSLRGVYPLLRHPSSREPRPAPLRSNTCLLPNATARGYKGWEYGALHRMNADGSGLTVVARGACVGTAGITREVQDLIMGMLNS